MTQDCFQKPEAHTPEVLNHLDVPIMSLARVGKKKHVKGAFMLKGENEEWQQCDIMMMGW